MGQLDNKEKSWFEERLKAIDDGYRCDQFFLSTFFTLIILRKF